MRIPKLALALVAAIVLVACGDDDGDGGQAAPDPSETSDGSTGDSPGASVDDGVAAVVDGEEISTSSIDEHVDALAENPQFSEQLEGDEGEAARGQLRAQILSTVIQTDVVTASAAELDRPVTEEDLEAARAEIESQVGGPEALDDAMEQQGLTEALLEIDLRSMAALSNVQEVLDEQAGDDDAGEQAPDETTPGEQPELSPSDQRVQEFLVERLAETDVSVNPEYGEWNAEAGQVVPAGGAPGPGQGGQGGQGGG